MIPPIDMHRIHNKIAEEGWIPSIKSEDRLRGYLYTHPSTTLTMLFTPDSENSQMSFYLDTGLVATFFYDEYLAVPLEELLLEHLL